MGRPDIHKDAKPFKKNDPRINRAGRPKMPDISEALNKVLNEEKDGITALDAVLKALRNKAVKGDVRAAQELFDRAYGKAKQVTDINLAVMDEMAERIANLFPGDE
jgi:ferritin-like metal-binding protein YciE